ncbi:MAG: hypothetical protein ACRCTE_13915 [Cellulosilyticaceae bacterium]
MMMRKKSYLILMVLVFGVYSIQAIPIGKDVAIKRVQELNLIEQLEYIPDKNKGVTKEEGAVMLVELFGDQEAALLENHKSVFQDVGETNSVYIGYLYDKGIITGINEKLFGSAHRITYQEFMYITLKYLGYKNVEWDKDVIFKEYTSHVRIDEYILTKDMMAKQMSYEDFAYMIYITIHMQENASDRILLEFLLETNMR